MNHTNVSSCFATTFLAFITPRHVTQVQRDRRWLHSETSWYQVEEEEKETKGVDLCIFFISVKRKQILWKMKPTRDEIGKEVTKWERERERERKKSNHIIHTQKPFIPFFSLHVKAVKIIHFSSFELLYKQTFIRMHKIFLFFYTVRYIGYLYKNHKYKLLQFNKSLGQLDLWMEPIRHWGIKDTIYTNTSLVHVTCDLGSCTNSKMFEINPMSSSYPERHENNFFFF